MALRYFATQGDTRRLESEIARLRALYPDWSPPADLTGAPVQAGDPELDRMWRLFGEGKLGEVRSAIADRSAREAAWQPPRDLLDKLDAAEASRRLVNASNNRQWATVLGVATETPGLLTCANVDTLWRVAEAYARTDKSDRARDVYRYILSNCGNAGERIATVQKAAEILSDAELGDLLRLERKSADGRGEFQAIRADLARTRVGKAAQDPKVTVDPDELASVERLARPTAPRRTTRSSSATTFTATAIPTRSLEWFKRAVDRKGGARAAEGHALALIELKRFEEAEAVAEPFRSATLDRTPGSISRR